MLRYVKFFVCLFLVVVLSQYTLKAQDLKSAIRLSESEQYDASHKAFDDLLAAQPTNGEIYFYYGESFLKQYFVDSAAASLSEAANSALQYFNKGIEKAPADPLNYIGAGRVYILQNKRTEADASIQKAKDLMPLKGMKYTKSDIPTTKQALSYAKIAEAYLKAPGFTKEALLEIIDNATERSTLVPEVYLIKGDIYLNYNDGSSAIVAYNKANELDPKSCKAMVKIGQLWMRAKSYNDALDYYKKAIDIESTFAPAYRERAELYGLAQQWDNGIKDYEKFIELSGNNFYAKVRYAAFLYMAKKYEEAVKYIEELKTLDKDAINKNYNYVNRLEAYSYYNLNNYQDALTAIKTFFQYTKPDKIMADDYSYYGDILSKLGTHDEASQKYIKALELDSTNYDLYSKISKEYAALKQYDLAAKYIELKISSGKPTLMDYYEAGKTCLNAKKYDKADTCFGSVLAQKPDYINAVMYRAQGRSIVDSTSELGLAKPYYENLVTLSLADSAKYVKYLTTAYSYLRYYYFKQYNMNKKCEDAKKSIGYCDKILAIDPKDQNSIDIKKSLAVKCPY
ncbi:MAG TPA: tetratricopeptide repeat protein [Bacteroidales bacterium]|mgnify:CR=1 FL=1|nr:tetratricopeptide repeat protein [Bacteroidales bacterium]HPS17462.1 tetratricopeptide repeat protein [Bacteroidales bacterium]